MKDLFKAISSISLELNEISQESIPREIENLKFRGDNANFAISIFQEHLINPNSQTKEFLKNLAETVYRWADIHLLEGYEKMATAHHGPELFIGFLPRYIDVFPEEERSKSLILEAAEYIGNWKNNGTEWYDYENQTFRSWYLGSKGVETNKIFAYETADHIRFIHIALVAWKIGGGNKYIEWALNYGKKFAKRITDSDEIIPVAWGLDGTRFYPEDMKEKAERFLAANHHHLAGDKLSGLENFIASGAIYAFGDLYSVSQEMVFKEAAKEIVSKLLNCASNPYADPVAAAISYYRNTFEDYSFDEKIIEISKNIPSYDSAELALVIPEKNKIRLAGIGNRKDMVYWQLLNLDGKFEFLTEPPTSFFTLIYQITGDINHAYRALTMAARKFKIARSALRSGYEHADMGRAVCSVSSGHGRNWGIGSVTGCYSPLILGTSESFGSLNPIIEWTSSNISMGCISIIRRLDSNSSELNLFNFSNNNIQVEIFIVKSKTSIKFDVAANTHLKKRLLNS